MFENAKRKQSCVDRIKRSNIETGSQSCMIQYYRFYIFLLLKENESELQMFNSKCMRSQYLYRIMSTATYSDDYFIVHKTWKE